MKLEQHLYTSGKTEFTTIAMTDGLRREDRLILEKNSLYILPTSLMYQENIDTPIKYVYYPLDQDRFVAGKAIYAGKDSLGRPGNYLFHNVIVRKDELLIFFGLNPVAFIRYLERQDIFRAVVPEAPFTSIEIAPSPYGAPPLSFPKLQQEELSQLLHICLHHDTVQLPLLMSGESGDCLDFLERLYPLLPFELRTALSFDTYTYGVNEGFRLQGLPEQPEYRQRVSPSATLNLSQSQLSVQLEIPAPSKRLMMMNGLISSRNLDMLNKVYELEYDLHQEHYETFLEKFQNAAPDIQGIILDFYREPLLRHIVDTPDAELLRQIQHQIRADDLNILVESPEMIHRFLEPERKRHSEIFAEWLCISDVDKTACYPFLFKWISVWTTFLTRAVSSANDATAFLSACRTFPTYYKPDYEERLLDEFLTILPAIVPEKKLAKEFLAIFTPLPAPQSESIAILRTAVIYALGNDPAQLTTLLGLDLSSLSEGRQWHVFGILLRGILGMKDLEKMRQQLSEIFHRFQSDPYTFQLFMHVLEESERPKKAGRMLNELLGSLPRDKMTDETKACVQRLTTPPPSFFQRVREKIFG